MGRIAFQTPRGNSLLCNEARTPARRRCRPSFKPLAGIHSSATRPCASAGTPARPVSNPSREFTPLQLGSRVSGNCGYSRFKPLAGIHSSATFRSRSHTPAGPRQVSNPSREFTPLQLVVLQQHLDELRQRFKPLAGIHSSATCDLALTTLAARRFQTPRGNSLLCNSMR